MSDAAPWPRSPGIDGAVGFTPRQHRVYDELVTRSGSRGPDPDRVPREPGGARDDPEIWRIMQDEENGLRSPSPGRLHFLTRRHSEGRFPHQWPTPWRENNAGTDRPCKRANTSAESANGPVRSLHNDSITVQRAESADSSRIISTSLSVHSGIARNANHDRSGASKRRRETLLGSRRPAREPKRFGAIHSCNAPANEKSRIQTNRVRYWASKAIPAAMRSSGQPTTHYISVRKIPGEERKVASVPDISKKRSFYESLEAESGMTLPTSWKETQQMCVECFTACMNAL